MYSWPTPEPKVHIQNGNCISPARPSSMAFSEPMIWPLSSAPEAALELKLAVLISRVKPER